MSADNPMAEDNLMGENTKAAAEFVLDEMVEEKSKEVTRQCTASSKTSGTQCRKSAIPGGNVCYYHGGAASQVKKKARLRLIELVDPAIFTLASVMTNKKAKHSDQLKAAAEILDRAGVVKNPDGDAEIARELLLERLIELKEEQDAVD